jgi:hypothetical protein
MLATAWATTPASWSGGPGTGSRATVKTEEREKSIVGHFFSFLISGSLSRYVALSVTPRVITFIFMAYDGVGAAM